MAEIDALACILRLEALHFCNNQNYCSACGEDWPCLSRTAAWRLRCATEEMGRLRDGVEKVADRIARKKTNYHVWANDLRLLLRAASTELVPVSSDGMGSTVDARSER